MNMQRARIPRPAIAGLRGASIVTEIISDNHYKWISQGRFVSGRKIRQDLFGVSGLESLETDARFPETGRRVQMVFEY